MVGLVRSLICVVALVLALPGRAPAQQAATPGSLALAKELIIETKIAEHIKLIVPAFLQQMKPQIAKGNPLIERDIDALMPFLTSALSDHLDTFLNSAAQIYAKEFSADELKEVLAFYRTPTGRRLVEKLPGVMMKIQAASEQFGQSVAGEAVGRLKEELRKRGHNI